MRTDNFVRLFVSPSKSIIKKHIGPDLMFSFILMGRFMYSHYKKVFGVFYMDCYASRTFLKAVTKVAAALIKRQNFEVSESVLRSFTYCILFVSTPLMNTHTRCPHLLPYRLRLPRNTCVSSQSMYLSMRLWDSRIHRDAWCCYHEVYTILRDTLGVSLYVPQSS